MPSGNRRPVTNSTPIIPVCTGHLRCVWLHGVLQVKSDDAVAMAGRLATEEGLFCGISSGAAVAAAVQVGRGEAGAVPRSYKISGWGCPRSYTVAGEGHAGQTAWCSGVKVLSVQGQRQSLPHSAVGCVRGLRPAMASCVHVWT